MSWILGICAIATLVTMVFFGIRKDRITLAALDSELRETIEDQRKNTRWKIVTRSLTGVAILFMGGALLFIYFPQLWFNEPTQGVGLWFVFMSFMTLNLVTGRYRDLTDHQIIKMVKLVAQGMAMNSDRITSLSKQAKVRE